MVKVEASSVGISKVLKMAEKPNTKKARAAINQKKYRNKPQGAPRDTRQVYGVCLGTSSLACCRIFLPKKTK